MSHWRSFGPALALAAVVTACSGGDDGSSAATTVAATASTTAAVATAAPTTTSDGRSPATSGAAGTQPATSAPGSTAAATTIDDAATGDPLPVGACALLDAARIEAVLGGPVSEPSDLETSCEWTVGDAASVPDTLILTVEGTADDLADTRDLLGSAGTDVPEAADGGVYWADFTTLYFVADGRLLSVQFLAPEADDPLGGLVALANRVG